MSAFQEIPASFVHRWNKTTHPFTAAAVIGVDGDGSPDIFVDGGEGQDDRRLLNNGDLTFTGITASSGTASKQNTFTSTFADLDADGRQDLIVSQNTGEVEMAFAHMKRILSLDRLRLRGPARCTGRSAAHSHSPELEEAGQSDLETAKRRAGKAATV